MSAHTVGQESGAAAQPHRRERDQVLAAAGVRLADRSVTRPRYVAKQRPWWLAWILRVVR